MRERQSLISSKRPKLTRSGGYFADAGRCEHDGDDRCHDRRARVALCGVVEYLNERFVRRTCQHAVNVADAEDEGDAHDQSHDSVWHDGPDKDFRKYNGGVLHLLSWGVKCQQIEDV